MKTKIIALAAILLLTGCFKEPVSTSRTDNSEINVELLFEHDGVKVYRFTDGGRAIYYTDARGATQWSVTHSSGNRATRLLTQSQQPANPMPPPTPANERKAEHTPTPWTFDEVPTSCGRCFRIGSREIIDGHEASKSLGARTLPAYACIYDDYGSGETVNKANAALIVTAVNSYASLRQSNQGLCEALETVLDSLGALANPSELQGRGLTKKEQAEVFAALAKAKGDQPHTPELSKDNP